MVLELLEYRPMLTLFLDLLSTVPCVKFTVKFQSLDNIYNYTNQADIADVIKHRQRNFMLKLQTCSNLVIRLVVSAMLLFTDCTV